MSQDSTEAARPLGAAFPPERAGGIRARQLEARLGRLHSLLALERSAWEASRGTQTFITRNPGPKAGSGFDAPGLRIQPGLSGAMAELSAELRLLRREVELLRRGGIGPAAGLPPGMRTPFRTEQPLLSQVPADVLAGATQAQAQLRRNAARRAMLSLQP